jgi:hypothetical protein
VAERFAAGLPQHLNAGGCALVLLSTEGDGASFLRAFQANGLALDVIAERDLGNEVLTVYRVTAKQKKPLGASLC